MQFHQVQAGDVTIHVGQGARPSVPQWPVVVGLIPPRADCFQDRPSAWAGLIEASAAGRTAVVTQPAQPTQVVSGLGGVGKTQLAGAYARYLLDIDAVDVLVWVPAVTRAGIVARYALAAEGVGLASGDDPEVACERFVSWMSTTDRRWVVVLDDLTAADDMRGLWPPDHRPCGRTVVTTRRRDATLLSGRQLVDLDVFTAEEANAYLTERLPAILADDTGGVAADLGGLPLALAHAAAFMLDRDLTCSRYRIRFADRRRRLSQLFPHPDSLFDDAAATVATTWSMSIERANQLSPTSLAGPLLELASMLDPDGIPATVFTTPAALTFLTDRTSSDLDAALDQDLDEDAVRDGLTNLRRFNLITVTGTVVRVHALVQRAVHDSLSETGTGSIVRAAADAVLELWPDIERDAGLTTLLRANSAVLDGRAEADALWTSTDGSHSGHPLLFRAVRSLGEAGLLPGAIAAATRLYQQADRWLGADHPDTMTARDNLAHWRGRAGDVAGSVKAYELLLADRLRVLGADHPDTLTARSYLAFWRGQAGDAAGAVGALEEVLADVERLLGADHPLTLDTRGDLAWWRGQAGDAAGAVGAFEEVLADRLRVLGADHPRTRAVRSNLANWRSQAGDAAGAVGALEEVLADCLRVLGADHPHTLTARNSLAWWRGEAGDVAGAVGALEEVLADRLRVLGADHPDTLATRDDLAWWRGEAGDVAGAVGALEEVLADVERVLGADHPRTRAVRSNLANWRSQAEDLGN